MNLEAEIKNRTQNAQTTHAKMGPNSDTREGEAWKAPHSAPRNSYSLMKTRNAGNEWGKLSKKRNDRNPLGRDPYAHPDDANLEIYPEPRRYGYQAGKLDQIEIPWLDKPPNDKASHNREKYALREPGYP